MTISCIKRSILSGAFIAVLAVCLAFRLNAEPPKISGRLSAPVIEMGDRISLDLQVVSDRGAKGRLPIFDGIQRNGFATMCGDTIELSANYSSSSIDLNSGRIQTDYKIPVQVFDSGFYTLPPIAYVSGRDTAFTQPLTLKVVPVPALATDSISDYTGVLSPGKGSFYDSLPMWLLEWWGALVIGAILIVAVLLFLMRYKRVRLKRAAKPLPPYEEACRDLDGLKQEQLWQKGEGKEYYTRLVDILRRYISRRFEIPAMEMTTDSILRSVRKHNRLKPYQSQFETVLSVADFAKFANMAATPQQNEAAFDDVKKFVEATRPDPEELKLESEKEKKASAGQKKATWERRKPRNKVKDKGKGGDR